MLPRSLCGPFSFWYMNDITMARLLCCNNWNTHFYRTNKARLSPDAISRGSVWFLLSFLFCLKETFCYSAHTVLSKHLEWVIAPLMEIHLAWSEVWVCAGKHSATLNWTSGLSFTMRRISRQHSRWKDLPGQSATKVLFGHCGRIEVFVGNSIFI